MWSRQQLKENAKVTQGMCYWQSVLVAFIAAFCLGGAGGSSGSGGSSGGEDVPYVGTWSPEMQEFFINLVIGMLVFVLVAVVIGAAFQAFLLNPLYVGTRRCFLCFNCQDYSLDHLGYGFKGNYKNCVKIMFLRSMFNFFWYLLFIVPGVIKAYEYRMIPYIIAENPNISSKEAFALSKKMMDGEKMETFILDLSFIGWQLLSVFFTCGILSIFYVNPYVEHTNAQLYFVLKSKIFGSAYGANQYAYAGGYQNGGYQNNGYQNNNYQNYGQAYNQTSDYSQTYTQNYNQNYNNQNYNNQNYNNQNYNNQNLYDGGNNNN